MSDAAALQVELALALRRWAALGDGRSERSVTVSRLTGHLRVYERRWPPGDAPGEGELGRTAAEVVAAARADAEALGRPAAYRVRVDGPHGDCQLAWDPRGDVERGTAPLWQGDKVEAQAAAVDVGSVRGAAVAAACERARLFFAGLDLRDLPDGGRAAAELRHRLRAPSEGALQAAAALLGGLRPPRQGQAALLSDLMSAARPEATERPPRGGGLPEWERMSRLEHLLPARGAGEPLTWDQLRELVEMR